jgi:D-aminoacyl-tRNA deacylase
MIALLQRVARAQVTVDDSVVGSIDRGILALVCAEPEDDDATVERLLTKILDYRVFSDAAGRMNRSLVTVAGGLLLVPQFTLAADTQKGTRPSFSGAAAPERALALFDHLLARARQRHAPVASGRFGAHMQVHLINDGPVTFWLQVHPGSAPDATQLSR